MLSLAAATAAVSLVLGPSPALGADQDDAQIVDLVAAARQDAGRAPLARNAALDAVAAAWARRMADEDRMYHNPELASQVPEGWRSLGENVANGYRDAASVHDGWMHSPGHRANILGEGYTDIGVAFLRAGGTTWGVEVFATYPDGSAGAAARTPATQPTPEATAPGGTTDEPTADAPARATAGPTPRHRSSRAAERSRRTPPAATPAPTPTPTATPAPTPSATPTPAPSADDLPTLEPVYPLLGDAEPAAPDAPRPALAPGLAVGLPAAAAVGGAGVCALVASRRARLETPGRHRR